MKKDYLVAKSNEIIEASYSLSVNEQRLLLSCLGLVDSRPEAEDFDVTKGYTLTVEQARDLFYSNKDAKNAYRDLKEASESLYRREIKIRSENGRYEMLTRWVSSVKFDNEDMTATLYFHEQIKPYISQLKGNFTRYRLNWIVELKAKYSVRVYEMIVSWSCQNKPYKEIELKEFKELLDLGEKYTRHSDFVKKVIDPALKEINEHTDFELEITFRKRGRAFRWIQLRYNQKSAHASKDETRKVKREDKAQIERKEREAQKQLQSFLEFSRSVKIEIGMRFYSETAQKIYEVMNGNIINAPELKTLGILINEAPMKAYSLDEEAILRLLYQNELRLPNEM